MGDDPAHQPSNAESVCPSFAAPEMPGATVLRGRWKNVAFTVMVPGPAVMLWFWRPVSDQFPKSNVSRPSDWAEGAPTELLEFVITVALSGEGPAPAFRETVRPGGSESTVTLEVWGKTLRVFTSVSPRRSVAVS